MEVKNNQTPRDLRQQESLGKWFHQKMHGTIEAATGFGKTEIALKALCWFQRKHSLIKTLVVVPTNGLKDQWEEKIKERLPLPSNVQVMVINSVIKNPIETDILILDEIHRYPAETFSQVFEKVTTKYLMGLTATFERLDLKHSILNEHAPIIDKITTKECLENGWVSNFKEYVVVVDGGNLTEYEAKSKEVLEHLEFFDNDFSLALSMTGKDGWKNRLNYARDITHGKGNIKEVAKDVAMHAFSLMRAVQWRKSFIGGHPEKIRVAEEIIDKRRDRKIITFSSTIKTAREFNEGYVYTGDETKKENQKVLEAFKNEKGGAVLNTSKMAEEGIDIGELSVGIMTGINSSKTKHQQTRGRVIRKCEDKEAEFYTLILKDTVEVEWWRKYNGQDEVEILDEENLLLMLDGKEYETYSEPLRKFRSTV